RPASSAHTSTASAHSAGLELTQATKARYAQLCQQRKRMEPAERQPLPALHLHLSKDGTSPLPPGWQRAPNVKREANHTAKDGSVGASGDEIRSSDMYAYYYYHVRTRQTRWDPPVYPWDADPHDVLTGETGEDDPEAPYNWGCASKYSVTHEEIEAMYARLRQRILERQCTELLHEVAGRPDAPQGAAEQGFAIELFTLVHNVLRTFRDARCKVGRIANDEDLYYLTKKLAQAVILKEVQHLHQAQAASSASLFAAPPPPELTTNVQARVTTYVRKYMESKGSFYRRRVQQVPGHPQPQHHNASHLHHPYYIPHGHHMSHHHNHPELLSRQNHLNNSATQVASSRTIWPNSAGPVDRVSASPKPVHNAVGFEDRQ
ncbi:Histone-lysine N-methyltransferase SETD2, partial [Fasciolopsis buskii]